MSKIIEPDIITDKQAREIENYLNLKTPFIEEVIYKMMKKIKKLEKKNE